ncbi:MAG TPA: SusC/RagA family TonB-linked outer membrane protein, partial [Puia sp.]|nr:SusC/RagA family TonB-linked outer membrane protein [Puia sp.]
MLVTRKLTFALFFFLSLATTAIGQSKFHVEGKVKQSTAEPLAGATIAEKGASTSTLTREDGSFTIDVSGPNATLVISYVGYTSKEIKLNGQQRLDITFQSTPSNLDEVVVIGYGTTTRKDLTGSVASVSGKTISAIPVPNIAQAMQGKLPGVSVVSQDGRPDADVEIRVRGGGSISQSNQPLILIDGVPGTLSDIPPDQVKTIDVLKDASSTAIYGARGANGVVLVTTKGAQEGKTRISYNGYVKFNTPAKYLGELAPYDYLKYVWANAAANGAAYQTPFEQLFGLGANAGKNTGGIESYRTLQTDNEQKLVYNNSTSSNHDLTITGGTDRTKMLFSVNYANEQGMKINSYLKRANVSFKLSQKLFDNLIFNLDTRYTDIQDMDDEGTTNGSGSILSTAYRFRPIATNHILGDTNALKTGNIEQYGKNAMWDLYSPAARIADFNPLSISQGARAIASLDWKIIKGLVYHTDLTLSRSWGQKRYWSGAVYNNYVDDAGNHLFAGAVDYGKSDSWGMRWSNTLNYDFIINSNNRLNLLAGQEVSNSGGSSMDIQANHFPSNFDKTTAFAQINQYDQVNGTSQFSSSVTIPSRLLSYFGRANYSLMD